jgi:hypothetical protein
MRSWKLVAIVLACGLFSGPWVWRGNGRPAAAREIEVRPLVKDGLVVGDFEHGGLVLRVPVTPAAPQLPADAQEVLTAFEREAAEVRRKAEAAINERRQETIRRLQALQDSHTRAARLDEAVAVRDTIRRLQNESLGAMPDPGTLFDYHERVGQSFHFEVTGDTSGYIWGTDIYTADSTLATAAVHAGVLRPGQRGVVKVTILAGQSSYAASTRHGVSSYRYDSYPGSYRIEAAPGVAAASPTATSTTPAPPPSSAVLADPVSLSSFRDRVGQTLRFDVTGRTNGVVWGDDLYTDDSTLATAAVHAGVLTSGQRGVVDVQILGSQASYTGSTRNGVTSYSYGNWGGSYRVLKSSAATGNTGATGNIIDATKSSVYLSNYRGQTGQALLFRVTGSTIGSVWGTNVYTDDSDLATAAVHSGAIANAQTGVVRVTILAGQSTYTGSARNGVTSRDWSSWLGSFKVENVEEKQVGGPTIKLELSR